MRDYCDAADYDGLKAAGVSTIEQPAREAPDKGAPLAEAAAVQRVLEPEVIVIVAPIVPVAEYVSAASHRVS
jgi:hypothetical protein